MSFFQLFIFDMLFDRDLKLLKGEKTTSKSIKCAGLYKNIVGITVSGGYSQRARRLSLEPFMVFGLCHMA